MENPKNPEQVQTIYKMTTEKEPLVSVIITTKNEEKNIPNCLESIKNQSYKNIEVILVDNFSVDKTVNLAEKYRVTIYFKGNERSAQRNYGAKVAKGEYLLYLDADMILESTTLIQDCVAKCRNDNVDALYVPEKIVGTGFWIKVRDFERSFYTGTVIDAVRFIRTSLFLKVEGFDETLIGPEDWDFDRKIRNVGRTEIADVSLCHNEGHFNMKRYLEKKGYYTDGIQRYIDKWGEEDPETAKQTGSRYRLFGVFVENGKWRNLIKHPLLTVGMYFLRLRVAIKYVENRA